MSRAATLARVLETSRVSRGYETVVDVRESTRLTLASVEAPSFCVDDFVALGLGRSEDFSWNTIYGEAHRHLCSRGELGFQGHDSDEVFIIRPGVQLRSDPAFAAIGADGRAMTPGANPSMLVVPSWSLID